MARGIDILLVIGSHTTVSYRYPSWSYVSDRGSNKLGQKNYDLCWKRTGFNCCCKYGWKITKRLEGKKASLYSTESDYPSTTRPKRSKVRRSPLSLFHAFRSPLYSPSPCSITRVAELPIYRNLKHADLFYNYSTLSDHLYNHSTSCFSYTCCIYFVTPPLPYRNASPP